MTDVIATVLQKRAVELAGAITAAEAEIALTVSQVADAAVRIAGKKAELTEPRTQLKAIEAELKSRTGYGWMIKGIPLADTEVVLDEDGKITGLAVRKGVFSAADRANTITTTSVAAEPPPARADD